jgi:isoleucyl-tRNA synthetase
LWVEVNVEREMGFNSKREIEEFGLDRFVNLCKQQVLKYSAVQTEQSIRLGFWMDWNDPDMLRTLRKKMAEDPSEQITVEGPHGPVMGSVESIVGRLGANHSGRTAWTSNGQR